MFLIGMVYNMIEILKNIGYDTGSMVIIPDRKKKLSGQRKRECYVDCKRLEGL